MTTNRRTVAGLALASLLARTLQHHQARLRIA